MSAAPDLKLNDVDSHEMIPMHMWESAFGPGVRPLIDLTADFWSRMGKVSFVRPDIEADELEINETTIWNKKGPQAPGAIDMKRRAEVLRAMGVERQLVLPSMAVVGLTIKYNADAPTFFAYNPSSVDADAVAQAAIDAQNKWAAEVTRAHAADGIVPVALVLTGSLDEMMRQTEQVLADGVRAVWIPTGVPPADTSPADRALDPFWSMLAAANVPVILHLATEYALISPEWHANVPEFVHGATSSREFVIEPFSGATLNLANETFLAAMVLGGVFERHPTLRLGVLECGAQWVGSLAERLDTWSTQYDKRLSATLSTNPSEYLARNVRVTPFSFEPVATYFERWPNLASVFTYSSDYPYLEGGREPKRRFYDEIAPLGADVVDLFFHTNGTWLLPD